MRFAFEKELNQLHEDIEMMGKYVVNAIDKITISLETQNTDLAKEIIAGDVKINNLQREIESRCLIIITMQQPVVSKDLRLVSAALKVVTDMERIADHAADIAELVLKFEKEDLYHFLKSIPEMLQESKDMVEKALKSFIESDIENAKKVIARDDIIDDLFDCVKAEIIDLIKSGNANADNCVYILMIAKYIERIGDHAVNICEWAEFQNTGTLDNVRIL